MSQRGRTTENSPLLYEKEKAPLANRSKNIITTPYLGLLITENIPKIIAWLKLIWTNGYAEVEKYVKRLETINIYITSAPMLGTLTKGLNLSKEVSQFKNETKSR